MSNNKLISLVVAFRVNENEVRCLYKELKTKYEFLITWNNVHPENGEVTNYDLQLECLSDNELLRERVIEVIRNGETDDEDGDLYIEIRDKFNSLDCESL